MKHEEEKCCGNCSWFKHEDTDGWGVCYNGKYAIGYHVGDEGYPRCSQPACKDFVSNVEKRHHMAVLIQANRYRRDRHVPSIYRMPNPTELGKAIDFALNYMKTFNEI